MVGCYRKLKQAVDSASLDAIKVMTIHKSKGLEFPCVHIPFCGLPHNRQSDIAWFGTRNAEGSLIDDFVRDGFDKDCVPPFVPLSVGKALEGTMFDSRYKEIVSENMSTGLTCSMWHARVR